MNVCASEFRQVLCRSMCDPVRKCHCSKCIVHRIDEKAIREKLIKEIIQPRKKEDDDLY